ncbi:fluoride efflux transporter CrcB [Halobacillus litoralis]|uniref:fluoride efflux transporter CrcB n=1 Tax=Halobacillus litoralis TaxID=45668 RepID=UPI001CD7DD98|nr:fluoride efflux transporter CrcB [Halobacillus litoralis]MCA0971725.1 fluoride efflux transporter CrcB [Halobacillus litoralis]
MTVLYIFIGGMIGAVARFKLSEAFNRYSLPVGTLIANLSGGLLLGFLIQIHESTAIPEWFWYLSATGFCGGYTTYSTFSYEILQMFEKGAWFKGTVYFLVSILATLAGLSIIWIN